MKSVSTERRRRGPIGWIVTILFWVYNGVMAAWLVAGLVTMEAHYRTAETEADREAMAAGLAVGVGVIIVIWSLGGLVLGMLMLATRRRASRRSDDVAAKATLD